MPSHSKVTEALCRQVVQMKSDGLPVSAIAREVGRSKSVISRILKLYNDTKSFKSRKKAGRPRKASPREDRLIQRLSMGDRFDTAAGISRQITDVGLEVSRHTVSRRMNEARLNARSPAIKPLISKKKSTC